MKLEERFWEKVEMIPFHSCWEWTAARNQNGYGVIRSGGNALRANRVAWEIANGPIPEGMCVLHRCDNPPCVNPAHLFLGTMAENMRDRDSKGRGDIHTAINASALSRLQRTACKRGHELSTENTYIQPKGSRACKECHRGRCREWYRRQQQDASAGTQVLNRLDEPAAI